MSVCLLGNVRRLPIGVLRKQRSRWICFHFNDVWIK